MRQDHNKARKRKVGLFLKVHKLLEKKASLILKRFQLNP